jgi:hypothetical protein
VETTTNHLYELAATGGHAHKQRDSN